MLVLCERRSKQPLRLPTAGGARQAYYSCISAVLDEGVVGCVGVTSIPSRETPQFAKTPLHKPPRLPVFPSHSLPSPRLVFLSPRLPVSPPLPTMCRDVASPVSPEASSCKNPEAHYPVCPPIYPSHRPFQCKNKCMFAQKA